MELDASLMTVLTETAQSLKGALRIAKDSMNCRAVFMCVDNFSARGRKRAEEHWPNLEQDIREIVGPQSQIDPSFKTERLYTRLSAEEVRSQLIEQKGYTEIDVPNRRTVSTKLNEL